MKRWPLHKANFWETAPFFRLLLPFAAGIVCYEYLLRAGDYGTLFISGAIVAFLLFVTATLILKNKGSQPLIIFALVCSTLFLCGCAVSYQNDIQNNKDWFGWHISNNSSYVVRISDAPAEKEHTWKVPVNVVSVIEHRRAIAVTGNAFLYLPKEGSPEAWLRKGDSILVPGKWEAIRNAGNPYEFDYAGYCRRNNIVYRQFCTGRDIILYSSNDPEHNSFTDRAHDWCMAQLDKYLPEQKTKGLMQAMLLGDEVNLDEDLRASYAETGIVHIIAISGGNVSIFFLVISALLWWIRHKKHLWIKYAVALPVVWFYVLMAGASPSAVRAALMFSLLAFAVMLQKNNNSLNLLLGTAFMLLCAQPMWLFSVGFQLSFMAVLSLVLFYKPVYKWLSSVGKAGKLLWSTISASIAAEVLVAPLVIYYFHNFPLLFLVANVAAFLFMGAVLVLGMAIVALWFVPAIATATGMATIWLVNLFDGIVSRLQQLSPASFHLLSLSMAELTWVYVAIAGLMIFLLKKQKAGLFTAMTALCVLMLSFCMNEWNSLHQRRFVVYNTGKTKHTELISGHSYAVISTDTAREKQGYYAVQAAHILWRTQVEHATGGQEVYCVHGKSILILTKPSIGSRKFPIDYLVVNSPKLPYYADVKRTFSPSLIVIGHTYPKRQLNRFMKDCADAGTAVHDVSSTGSFVLQ